jgi:hypothetical protein
MNDFEFRNEKVYSRYDMEKLLERWDREWRINKVIRKGDVDTELQILAVRKTFEGLIIEVR